MPRPATGRVVVTIRLDPEDVEWVDAAAAARGGIGRGEVIRRMVAASREAHPVAGSDTIVDATHPFKPQKGNALRCEECGQRKGAHG